MDSEIESNLFPQFFPRHWLVKAPNIVHTEFPSRICVGYVVRGTGNYAYLMHNDFLALGLSLVRLHELALNNLGTLPMPDFHVARTPGGSEAFLADNVDNFTSVRLLLPIVRQALASELGDAHLAAIPCRDWSFYWSKDQQADYQDRNRRLARETYLKDDHNLTPDVFMVSDAGFQLHFEQIIDD